MPETRKRGRGKTKENELQQPITYYQTKKQDQQVLLGAFGYLSYIGLWLAGLLSPLLVLAALVVGRYWIASILCVAIAVSYLPRSMYSVWPAMRRFYTYAATHYFKSSTMLLEREIDASVPSIYCIHPHGIFCIGWALSTLLPQLSHLTWCFSSVLEQAPFFRFFLRLLNEQLSGTSKAHIQGHLKQKKSIGIIPGGFEEATLTHTGVDRVYIKHRRGLFKYALQYGPYSVVPVYAFGERDTYSNLQGMLKFRLWLNSFSLPAIVPFGAWFCPILPRPDVEMTVVVGTPLQLPHIPDPTSADVAEWHGRYVERLEELFNRHSERCYGPGDHALEIH